MVASCWTDVEFDLLRALTIQVPCLTLDQIARGWDGALLHREQVAQSLLKRLKAARLVELRVVEVHPLLTLEAPLLAWRPGDAAPGVRRLTALSERATSRWNRPARVATIGVASRAAARLFGAFVDTRRTKHCEATHNVHVAELLVRRREKGDADAWLGEAAFPKLGFDVKGFKDPDAFLMTESGQIERVVEFAGSYPPDHLEAFHRHCAGGAAQKLRAHFSASDGSPYSNLYDPQGTAYELW